MYRQKINNSLKKKILIIEKILDFLYPNPINNLYHINNYTLLISIILTARCKEIKVNNITKKIFKNIKSPYDLIKLKIYKIKKLIEELGLHNKKSKYIYALSKILIKNYNGSVPKNLYKLKILPGVGHKTASVFLSNVSNKYLFPIDTHIHRMMYRWKLSDGKNIKKTEENAKLFFKKKKWKKLHLQIISYGKEFSPSRKWKLKKDIIYQELLKNNLL
ncbi:endonuclease III domain-containing protein [Blattabacterium cuenoti]|uniref:endonuclease III domain-containing protein n=1 Tax=Blattabacterium cuenoti TaxID=1653831 RepID=UPI001EEC1D0C|nr:endonuclease III [Blattabacterium cuenoti]